MAFTTQLLVKGVDFTALVLASGAQHNQLIELSTLPADKGIILYSIDSALDTPDVPNAAATVVFKRYLWVRKPHATATSTQPILYGWDDNGVNDATLLKWKDTAIDLTAFETQIQNALTIANAASATANAANVAAANAATIANQASNDATSALTTANNASAQATTAASAAASAQATATTAQTNATAALTAANAKRDISAGLNPGTTRQLIRTSLDAATVEWFNQKDTYVKLSHQEAKNTGAGGSLLGANVRVFNVEDTDTGGLCGLAANIFTLAAGTYRCRIELPFDTDQNNQAFLIKNSDNSLILAGTSKRLGGAVTFSGTSVITGIFTLAVATALRVDHYFAAAEVADGLGRAANIGPGTEVYSVAEFWLIG